MAVRGWTRGHLVVFWCALLAVTVLIAVVLFSMGGGIGMFGVWLFVFAVFSLPGLAVTWVWMGRERSN